MGGLSAGLSDDEGEENDVVELEKSNVLLMGPTGSGASRPLSCSNVAEVTFGCKSKKRFIRVDPVTVKLSYTRMNILSLTLDHFFRSIGFHVVCPDNVLRREITWMGFWMTGKTLLAKTLARFVNVPFVIADATTLTQVILLRFILRVR